MRLLSFLNQVETTLAMLRPEQASGWQRRADYHSGSALCWNPVTSLALSLRSAALGDGHFSIQTSWRGPTGAVLQERTFYCGPSSFEWQTAAEAVAEAMPEIIPPALIVESPAVADLSQAASA